MAMFTVRVELHGVVSEAIYKGLHDAMFAAGFHRFITGDDKKAHLLPTGMYHHPNSVETATQLMKRVVAIATTFQPRLAPPRIPWVLVTQGPSAWQLETLKT
jgi:hypothetical protein